MSQQIVRETLELCRAIELACAELYQALAECHADDLAAQQLWKKTAAEELQHARQFDVLETISLDAVAEVRVTPERARESLARLQKQRDDYLVQRPTVTMALEQVILMEREFARFHADLAVELGSPSMARVFKALAKADAGHIAALENELKRRRA